MNNVFLFCVAVVFLFVSCTGEHLEDSLFEQVESCMESRPDSALALLRQIECPEDLRGKEQADYALLLTQAYDKMYMDSLQSDSLIELATKYYFGKEDEKLKAGKAFFYYAKVMLLGKRYPEAMQAYLEAQKFIDGTCEYKLHGQIWEHIGYLNSIQDNYKKSVTHFKKSIEYYKLAGADSGLLYGYRNIARDYISIHNNDSAQWYAQKGLLLSDTIGKLQHSFFHILGLIASDNKQYLKAVDYYLSAIKCSSKLDGKCRYSLSLGNVYLEMGQDDKARDCFHYSRNSDNAFLAAGSYRGLSEFCKKRADYKKALEYKEISDSLLDIVHNKDLQAKILDLQSKYDNDKLLLENRTVKLKKEKQMYFYLFVLTLTVGVAIVAFVYLRKKYRKLALQNIEIIRNNNQIIEKYVGRISDLENADVRGREAKKEEIGKLNRKILCLTTENKKIRENTNLNALLVLEELKQGKLIVENMTTSEREHVFDFMDLVHADFVTRLKKDFKLNKSELLLAVLLKLGFSNKQLADVLGCEIKSLYKYRQRLKPSLRLGKDDSLDQMIMLY